MATVSVAFPASLVAAKRRTDSMLSIRSDDLYESTLSQAFVVSSRSHSSGSGCGGGCTGSVVIRGPSGQKPGLAGS